MEGSETSDQVFHSSTVSGPFKQALNVSYCEYMKS